MPKDRASRVLGMARDNGGMVTSGMVTKCGIDRAILRRLTDVGELERVERGVYTLPDAWADELVSVQSRWRRGVFSHATALWLHGLSDRVPLRYEMSFPRGYNTSGVTAAGVSPHTVSAGLYGSDVVGVTTPSGHVVRAYSRERSVCDALRARVGVDQAIATQAVREYVSSCDRDIVALTDCAGRVGVSVRLARYLEVLL